MRVNQVIAVALFSIVAFNSIGIAANSKKTDEKCNRGGSRRDVVECVDMKISASANDCPTTPHRGSGRRSCINPTKLG